MLFYPEMLATFAAGCFWGVEEAFLSSGKIISSVVGYSGGSVKHPTYHQVCSGKTGHAEVLQVDYDPESVSYGDLLGIFWKCHDPTQLNRQGPDVGSQYRSAIFFHDLNQKSAAEASKSKLLDRGIPAVTVIEPIQDFYPAEEYHQQYLRKTGRTCHF
jgi:peptide-methionine (S)-S-oxide reductase